MHQKTSGLLSLVLLAGCAGSMPTGPSAGDVDLDVQWASTIEGDVSVTATVTNISDRVLGMGCGAIWLEIETPDGWVLSKSPSCVPAGLIAIQPGEAREIGYESPNGPRYRIAVQFSARDGSNPIRIFSSPFELES